MLSSSLPWSGRNTARAAVGGELPARTLSVVRRVPSSTSGTEPWAVGASLPVMAESPFALSGGYPSRSRLRATWAGVTRLSSLLRTHAPDLDAPKAFALARSLGLRRLLRAPAANRPFPTLSLQSLSRRLDPYPAVMSRCFSSLLPKTQRPHITRDTFGSPDNSLHGNFRRGAYFRAAVIRSCSGSQTR